LGVLDTHVDYRGRVGRILRMMLSAKKTLGFGVDQDTAMDTTFNSDGSVVITIVGAQGCSFYDTSKVHSTTPTDRLAKSLLETPAQQFAIKGVTYHYLTRGDSITFSNLNPRGLITYAPWKTSLSGRFVSIPCAL